MENKREITTIEISAPPIYYPPVVGPKSVKLTCPYCSAHIHTQVKIRASWKTHLMFLLLCIGGCCMCACIPYCKKNCQNRNHYCPNCNNYLGHYEA